MDSESKTNIQNENGSCNEDKTGRLFSFSLSKLLIKIYWAVDVYFSLNASKEAPKLSAPYLNYGVRALVLETNDNHISILMWI